MTNFEAADKAFREWWDINAHTAPDNGDDALAEFCFKAAWRACESQKAERVDILERENYLFIEQIQKLEASIGGRIRAAVAEMREKVLALVGFSEEIVLVEKSEFRNLTRKILAIPINGDPAWLEKQLLDAELELVDNMLKSYPPITENTLIRMREHLIAERRALESKKND